MAFVDFAKRAVIRSTAGVYLKIRTDQADAAERIARLVNVRANNARALDVEDFRRNGQAADIPPAFIHTVANVESPSAGFDKRGRMIAMVEPHIFSALTFHAYDGPRYGCSYPTWTPCRKGDPPPPGFECHPYQLDQDGRWGLFAQMAELNVDAAIGALSLGRFQQLVGSPKPGMGWKLLRFASPEDLFLKLAKSEQDQLDVMLLYFQAHGAMEDLRRGNWRTIARVYNGPGQVDYYTSRLEEEFRRVARHYP